MLSGSSSEEVVSVSKESELEVLEEESDESEEGSEDSDSELDSEESDCSEESDGSEDGCVGVGGWDAVWASDISAAGTSASFGLVVNADVTVCAAYVYSGHSSDTKYCTGSTGRRSSSSDADSVRTTDLFV